MDLRALLGAVGARWLRIVLVTVLLLGTTYAILMFVPKLYESSASILVEQRTNAFTRTANDQQQANAVTMDSLMASQVELIKSRDNMLTVIEALNLRENPEFGGVGFSPVNLIMQLLGRKPDLKSLDQIVLDNLNERVTVRRENTSSVVSVYVQSEDPQLAADIANAIANAHVKRRADLSLADTAEATGWLENEISKLRVKVQDAETAVANYRATNDLFQSGTGQTSILDQQLSNIATQITSAQERKNSAQSRATLIRGLLQAGQPIDGVADVRNSLGMQNLMQSRATLQGELAQRSSTLLSNHPTIKALRAQISAIDTQITAEGRRVAEALEAEAKVEANLEQSLNDDLARLKLSVSTATRDTVTLDSLQREAKAQRDLLESYLARYSDAAARTDSSSTLPDVRVVTFAAPSIVPASPKTGLVLGAVAFLAVSLQVGAILFGELMSGRAVQRRVEPAEPYAPAEDEPDLFDDLDPEVEPVAAEHPFVHAAARRPEPEPEVAAVEPEPEPVAAIVEPEAHVPPPQPAPAPVAPPPQPEPAARNAGASALELSNLAADIAIGRVRVVMLAALSNFRDVERVSELLVRSALDRGLSVATIDAGSARLSAEPGLTDLAAEKAGFGDVVHKVSEGLAAVPWGHRDILERRSMKPVTLIEALTDIYEVVIVQTGRIGVTSTLPVFSGIDCRLVMVAGEQPDRDAVQSALAEAATLGYEVGQMVSAPAQRSVA
ncbi:MAG TPA: Wzz/FepE/Etk N-terminal domain-containing protein [Devosia sp.]